LIAGVLAGDAARRHEELVAFLNDCKANEQYET
jgi:hypothetical protein